MSNLAIIISILSLTIRVKSQSCAYEESYCVRGLNLDDFNSIMSAQYTLQGTLNGCPYFKSRENRYIYWFPEHELWLISSHTDGYTAYAHCSEPILDNCNSGKWTYYDGSTWYINSDLEVDSCSYDNVECLKSYDINDTYCIADVLHRETNTAMRGEYRFTGCLMNEPYFVDVINITTIGLINKTIQWDDVLSVWHISSNLSSAASPKYAYCLKSNLADCNENWYIGDSEGISLDPKVNSGYCSSCIENKVYDEICVSGGISVNEIIGRYAYSGCHHLYPSYRDITETYLAIEFYAWWDQYLMFDENDGRIDARCNGTDLEICIDGNDVNPKWSINNVTHGYEISDGLQISDCSDVDDQCNAESDYCVDIDDIDYVEFAGRYQYVECDENGYPVFTQYKDVNGTDIMNSSSTKIIVFDAELNYWELADFNGNDTEIYARCNSLLLDECDGFWLPSRREIEVYRCKSDDAGGITRSGNWWIFVVIALVLLCIVGGMAWYIVNRKKRNVGKGDNGTNVSYNRVSSKAADDVGNGTDDNDNHDDGAIGLQAMPKTTSRGVVEEADQNSSDQEVPKAYMAR